MKNPFGGDVPPRLVARYLQSPDKLAGLLKQDPGGWGATPAAILADIVTVQRADCKRLAEIHDVEMDVEIMSEDRAADLIAGVVDGDALDLVLLFNDLAHQRDQVLRAALDEDDYRQFMEAKTSVMHTDDPEMWDDEEQADDQAVEAEAVATDGGTDEGGDGGE